MPHFKPDKCTDMSNPTEAELRDAIKAAMRNAQFRFRKKGIPLSLDSVLSVIASVKNGVGIEHPIPTIRRELSIDLSDGGEPLATLLRESDTLRRFMNKERRYIHMVANIASPVSRAMSIEESCSNVVKSVFLHSLDEVVDSLSTFLNTGLVPIATLHFVKGTKVTRVITLDDDARLIPYSDGLDLLVDRGHIPATLPTDWRTAACVLCLDTYVRPGAVAEASSHPDEECAELKYSGLVHFGPQFLCTMLCLVTGNLFLPFNQYEIIPELCSDTLPMFSKTGSYGESNIEFPIMHSKSTLDDVDQVELVELLAAYAEAPASVHDYLRLPLWRLQLATDPMIDTDVAVDLQIAFEGLLGASGRYRSDRAAYLCDESNAGSITKILADFRNCIVHPQKKFKNDRTVIPEARAVLVQCIKKIIRMQEIPDWKELRLDLA